MFLSMLHCGFLGEATEVLTLIFLPFQDSTVQWKTSYVLVLAVHLSSCLISRVIVPFWSLVPSSVKGGGW